MAHIYGQNLAAAESLTTCDSNYAWAWSPATLKPPADQELLNGINRFVIHESAHQPLVGKAPGMTLGPCGQWFNRNETWAEEAGPWVSYIARSSYLLQQGHFGADLVYFYGEDSNLTAIFGGKSPDVPAGYGFDYVNADGLIHELRVSDGRITTKSGMSYRVLGLDPYSKHISLPVLRAIHKLREIATNYHNWVKHYSQKTGVSVLDAPEEQRREQFVAPYFRKTQPEQPVVILKAHEPARILVSIAKSAHEQGHLEYKKRWVDQYNFYLQDRAWGRMFVRICPYFPFPARVYLNQHYWLTQSISAKDIRFQQCAHAFLSCSDPERLQQLADSLQPQDILRCVQKWLTALVPFFTARERREAGVQHVQHRLFFAQAEYCDNLIFKRRAALDRLGERLLDANRSLGRPDSLSLIFGRRISKRYQGKLQTVIEDMHLGNPVLRAHYKNGFLKQYVRDHRILRTEPATNSVLDYGIKKAIDNLP